jgi:hypothetical protein
MRSPLIIANPFFSGNNLENFDYPSLALGIVLGISAWIPFLFIVYEWLPYRIYLDGGGWGLQLAPSTSIPQHIIISPTELAIYYIAFIAILYTLYKAITGIALKIRENRLDTGEEASLEAEPEPYT